MSLIGKVLDRWRVNAIRRKLGKAEVHCIFCGSGTGVPIKKYLALVNFKRVTDYPACGKCSALLAEARLEEADELLRKI